MANERGEAARALNLQRTVRIAEANPALAELPTSRRLMELVLQVLQNARHADV